jgi:tetratricopeptide (TPR) repeat protein
MKLNYLYVLLFFATILLGAALLFPTSLDVILLYRNSYLYGTALSLLDELDRTNPEDEQVILEQARVFYLVGRYERSVELLEKLVAQQSADADVWRQLGQAYRTLQQHRPAITAYEKVLTSAPADSQALYLLEEYYRWFQFGDERAANLANIVTYYPRDFYSHEKLIDLYLRMDRGDDAVRVIERTAATFPDSTDIQAELGQIYLSQTDERALSVFAALHEKYPEREDYFNGLLSGLIIADRREEALAQFARFFRPRLEDGDYYQRLGQLYLYLNDAEQALQILEEKVAIAPTFDTRLQLIDIYARLGRYDRAVDHSRQLVRESPERPDFWQTYVDYLATAEYREELVETLESYTARWPDDLHMLRELADAYEWVEDYQSALPISRRLFAAEPQSDEHRERLARLLNYLGDHAAAAPLYAGLLDRFPASKPYRQGLLLAISGLPSGPETLAYARQLYQTAGPALVEGGVLLARLYERQQQPDSADPIYTALTRAYPDSAQLHAAIGQLLLESRRLEEARAYFARSLDLTPSDNALSGLAAVAYEQNPPDALVYLRRLESRRPDDPDIAYRLGLTYEALSDTVSMVAHYRRLLQLVAGLEQEDLYSSRRKIHALYRTGDDRQAEELLKQARTRYPQNVDLINDYAEILMARGEHERALAILREVPEL